MNKRILLAALQRPIAFHKIFAQISGGITSGLFLSQLFYWHDKGSDPDGWIYKNYREWEEETTMTRRELDTARKRLKAIGVIQEKKAGAPAKLFYRIDFDRLITLISEFEPTPLTNKDGDNVQTSLAQSANLDCTNPPNSLLYTEITSETTSSGGTQKKADDDDDDGGNTSQPTAKTAIVEAKMSDPFYTGQARQIAREVVKVSRQMNPPRNFITDAPWGRLAEEIEKDGVFLFGEFKKYLIAKYSDKTNPESYCGKIICNLHEKPGSELNCQDWLEFADYFRKNLTAPPAPKKSEPAPVQIDEIPDREASKEAFRRLKR